MNRIYRMLKDEFREWYGMVSIEEIMSNVELIKAIESTEKVFTSLDHYFSGPGLGTAHEN